MKFLFVVFIIFFILVFLDKGLTLANMIQVKKNFPDSFAAQDYNIEKNPVARWFFRAFGLWGGTVVYLVISLITLMIAFYFLNTLFTPQWSLYILMMLYGLVIINNVYFLLKHSGVIP